MHKVLQSYLQQFVKETAILEMDESDQFERFVNFCQIHKFYSGNFDVNEVTTSVDDDAIDGVATIIGEDLISTSEEAIAKFSSLRPRQTLSVRYVFIQSKRSEGFDAGDMLKFGQGVFQLLAEDQYEARDNVLKEVHDISRVVIENLNKVENGRPDCLLYYATTGIWNEENNLRSRATHIEKNLYQTSLFNLVSFQPVDRDNLINLWNQTRTPVYATFAVQSILPLPPINKVAEAYLAVVPAKGFVERVLSDEDGRIRTSVFEHNVRAFLGDDNPVNSKIKQVLMEPDSHDRFSILNNGLTIVSPDVKVQGTMVSVNDFQIVNGCQTSHVLFRSKDFISDKVQIALRIIEANDTDILEQVVEATNSQSNVSPSQFLSIKPYVRGLELFFASFEGDDEADRKVYFERRTEQFAGQGISGIRYRVFDIEKLARVYAAMFLDVPHLAYRYPTQTFKEKSRDIYQDKQREYAYYAAALSYYRLIVAFNNAIDSKYRPYMWHILMIIKYQLGGVNMPGLSNRKLDPYCEKIITAIKQGGKAALPFFQDALRVIDEVGYASTDRLKRQAYTNEILGFLGCRAQPNIE